MCAVGRVAGLAQGFSSLCREVIPSGALTLDIALGGGFPKGRIIEVPTSLQVPPTQTLITAVILQEFSFKLELACKTCSVLSNSILCNPAKAHIL